MILLLWVMNKNKKMSIVGFYRHTAHQRRQEHILRVTGCRTRTLIGRRACEGGDSRWAATTTQYTTTYGWLRFSTLDGARGFAGALWRRLRHAAVGQQPQDQQVDESENEPLPKDHDHGKAARVRVTGSCAFCSGQALVGPGDGHRRNFGSDGETVDRRT